MWFIYDKFEGKLTLSSNSKSLQFNLVIRLHHAKLLFPCQDSLDVATSSLCLIMPESTRMGISAASHGARPKQSACAMPNLGLNEYQQLELKTHFQFQYTEKIGQIWSKEYYFIYLGKHKHILEKLCSFLQNLLYSHSTTHLLQLRIGIFSALAHVSRLASVKNSKTQNT